MKFLEKIKSLFKKKDKIKLKNGWDEITLENADCISNVIKDDKLSTTERNIKLLSLMSDKTENELWKLTPQQLAERLIESGDLFEKIAERVVLNYDWINTLIKLTKWTTKIELKIGDEKFNLETDASNIPFLQYQAFSTTDKNDLAGVLATILVPEGKQFASVDNGYDFEKLKQYLYKNTTVQQANDIIGFFLLRLLNSTTYSATFSEMMKN